MHIHHVIRGGLFFTGAVIGTLTIVASAEAGSHGVVTAPAAGVAAVSLPAPEVTAVSETLAPAPAAIPVLIEPVSASSVPDGPSIARTGQEEAEPGASPGHEVPVVQAGPGPATPVPGAVTLIDPLVIERDPAEPTA